MKSIYKEKLLKEIETIPEHHLKSVYKIVHEFKSLAKETKGKKSLKGIWKGKGFEKIDIEQEIKELRKHITNKIEDKNI